MCLDIYKKYTFEVENQKLTFLKFYDIIEERKGVDFNALWYI